MKRSLSCKIKCYTHKLNPDAFQIFTNDEINFCVNEISENDFILSINDKVSKSQNDQEFINTSHAVLNIFLVSLNVCTLGLFLPQKQQYLSPEYLFTNIKKNISEKGVVVHDIFSEDFSGQEIDETQTLESLWLYGALAQEKNNEIVAEYLKGLIHLGLNYPGTHFEKDAFANFYRTFEHLVTSKLLQKRKLDNELKEISEALLKLGLGQETLGEFKRMYILRSSQAMHAQIEPQKISRDDTLKMKVFNDVIIYRVYKSLWEKE